MIPVAENMGIVENFIVKIYMNKCVIINLFHNQSRDFIKCYDAESHWNGASYLYGGYMYGITRRHMYLLGDGPGLLNEGHCHCHYLPLSINVIIVV